MADTDLFKSLGEEIYNRYTQTIFARVSKPEIDGIVFHTFLLKNLDPTKITSNSIQYNAIDKDTVYRLSLAAGLTEETIQRKLEADFYAYRNKSDDNAEFGIRDFIESQLQSTKTGSESIKDGKVRLLVANPVVKKQFVNALSNLGFVPDYSFNRDIVSIGVLDVLAILGKDNDSANATLFEAARQYAEKSGEKTQEAFQKCQKGSSAKETVKSLVAYLGKTAYEKFLDAAFQAILRPQ